VLRTRVRKGTLVERYGLAKDIIASIKGPPVLSRVLSWLKDLEIQVFWGKFAYRFEQGKVATSFVQALF
jgi:hypothetical protein